MYAKALSANLGNAFGLHSHRSSGRDLSGTGPLSQWSCVPPEASLGRAVPERQTEGRRPPCEHQRDGATKWGRQAVEAEGSAVQLKTVVLPFPFFLISLGWQ